MSLSVEDIRQFLADASVSDSLYVRVYSDPYGTSEATFKAAAGGGEIHRRVHRRLPGRQANTSSVALRTRTCRLRRDLQSARTGSLRTLPT